MKRVLWFPMGLCLLLCDIAHADKLPESKTDLPIITITSLPENVKLIVGMTDDKAYLPRVQAVHALGKNLPQDQIDAFYDFLFQKLEDQELPDLEFNGLKNELTWALIWQERVPKELAKHLDTMFRDKSYDVTWRDYCVQFFGKYYRYVGEADRKILKAGLEEALNEWQNRIAGTAGYMLWQMSDYPGFDKQAIMDRIVEVLNQPDCSNASKLPLLQACGEAGDKRALPQARELMKTSKDIMLRASAIAAVGYLGDATDIPCLENLSKQTDPRVQKPAQAALEKINLRSKE